MLHLLAGEFVGFLWGPQLTVRWAFNPLDVPPDARKGEGARSAPAAYDVMLFTVASDDKVGHVIDSIARKRVDGVLLPAAGARDPLVRHLIEASVPTVLIGHRSRAANIGWVDSTHDLAAADLTRLMIADGLRRLVMLNGPKHISACKMRSNGFWSAVKQAGSSVDFAQEIEVELDPQSGFDAALKLLNQAEKPDGIVCAADSVASGCIDAARTVGVAVPEELSISGFDDSSFATHTNPQITTVRMPLGDIGRAAIELLVSMIEHEYVETKHVVMATDLVQRGSTRSPVPADHAVL